ncbi:hypothetical protein LZ086_18395 [Acinetobacter johnsonii]|nr:hypothetical protein LZ086_18395 [Acinetobacter johnsonii]
MKLWAVVVLACTISSFSFADTSTNSFKTPAGQTVTIGDQVQDMQKKSIYRQFLCPLPQSAVRRIALLRQYMYMKLQTIVTPSAP